MQRKKRKKKESCEGVALPALTSRKRRDAFLKAAEERGWTANQALDFVIDLFLLWQKLKKANGELWAQYLSRSAAVTDVISDTTPLGLPEMEIDAKGPPPFNPPDFPTMEIGERDPHDPRRPSHG